ncbi:hypothetical protein CWI37_1645p0010, partial [Hamiltosporidium tvaerminnensis]
MHISFDNLSSEKKYFDKLLEKNNSVRIRIPRNIINDVNLNFNASGTFENIHYNSFPISERSEYNAILSFLYKITDSDVRYVLHRYSDFLLLVFTPILQSHSTNEKYISSMPPIETLYNLESFIKLNEMVRNDSEIQNYIMATMNSIENDGFGANISFSFGINNNLSSVNSLLRNINISSPFLNAEFNNGSKASFFRDTIKFNYKGYFALYILLTFSRYGSSNLLHKILNNKCDVSDAKIYDNFKKLFNALFKTTNFFKNHNFNCSVPISIKNVFNYANNISTISNEGVYIDFVGSSLRNYQTNRFSLRDDDVFALVNDCFNRTSCFFLGESRKILMFLHVLISIYQRLSIQNDSYMNLALGCVVMIHRERIKNLNLDDVSIQENTLFFIFECYRLAEILYSTDYKIINALDGFGFDKICSTVSEILHKDFNVIQSTYNIEKFCKPIFLLRSANVSIYKLKKHALTCQNGILQDVYLPFYLCIYSFSKNIQDFSNIDTLILASELERYRSRYYKSIEMGEGYSSINFGQNTNSENIRNEKIKAVCNLENSAGEILMCDVDVVMLSERLSLQPTFHKTTYQPPSSSCQTSPVCLVDTIPSSSVTDATA